MRTSRWGIIQSLGGNDVIGELQGDDVICGGMGDDTIYDGLGIGRLLGKQFSLLVRCRRWQ